MHPTLIEFSERVGIHSYGLMILTALLFAFMVSSRRAKTVGIDPDDLPLMYLLVAALRPQFLLDLMLLSRV